MSRTFWDGILRNIQSKSLYAIIDWMGWEIQHFVSWDTLFSTNKLFSFLPHPPCPYSHNIDTLQAHYSVLTAVLSLRWSDLWWFDEDVWWWWWLFGTVCPLDLSVVDEEDIVDDDVLLVLLSDFTVLELLVISDDSEPLSELSSLPITRNILIIIQYTLRDENIHRIQFSDIARNGQIHQFKMFC